MIVVVAAATWGDWVIPMKSRAITTVDGRPPIKPPIFGPNLSALRVVKVTHKLPVMKLTPSLSQNVASMQIQSAYLCTSPLGKDLMTAIELFLQPSYKYIGARNRCSRPQARAARKTSQNEILILPLEGVGGVW